MKHYKNIIYHPAILKWTAVNIHWYYLIYLVYTMSKPRETNWFYNIGAVWWADDKIGSPFDRSPKIIELVNRITEELSFWILVFNCISTQQDCGKWHWTTQSLCCHQHLITLQSNSPRKSKYIFIEVGLLAVKFIKI